MAKSPKASHASVVEEEVEEQPISVTDEVDGDSDEAAEVADLEKQIEEEDVPAEVIEQIEKGLIDFGVPDEFMDELMGAELADHLSNYQKSIPVRRAARSSGDNQRAEQLSKFINTSRLAAAQIIYKYPHAKGIADEIARARASQVKEGRKAILDRDKE